MKAGFISAGLAAALLSWGVPPAWSQGAVMPYLNFDGTELPTNKEGVGYPTYYHGTYQGRSDGGTFSRSLDPEKKVAGDASLKMHFTDGRYLYAQFNPYDGSSRGFAREYVSDPGAWKFNTFNRLRLWLWVPQTGEQEQLDGRTNFYLGTYVKRVTNANRSSDEDGGGHYYHPFNVLRGVWTLCVFNSHPGHRRGQPGGEDSGNVPYPTSGDPANTYNYFDALTRWYISGNREGSAVPRDYWLDEVAFYEEPLRENDEQVYSICASASVANDRLFLTWNRPKDENDVMHEVRYAFSDIHDLGWANATRAPNGVVDPPGWQGYNGMVYDTRNIDFRNRSVIYIAIKPENSNVFSQIALPILGSDYKEPEPPADVRAN